MTIFFFTTKNNIFLIYPYCLSYTHVSLHVVLGDTASAALFWVNKACVSAQRRLDQEISQTGNHEVREITLFKYFKFYLLFKKPPFFTDASTTKTAAMLLSFKCTLPIFRCQLIFNEKSVLYHKKYHLSFVYYIIKHLILYWYLINMIICFSGPKDSLTSTWQINMISLYYFYCWACLREKWLKMWKCSTS